MFIHEALIKKNTPELRKYLENLGYHLCSCTDSDGWLFTGTEGRVHSFWDEEYGLVLDEIDKGISGLIDCGDNEEFFKAVVAIRDDTNKDQWFVANYNPDLWIKCVVDKKLNRTFDKDYPSWHKATLEELKEYFKNK